MLRKAMQGVDQVLAPSRYIADLFDLHYGVQTKVSVPPVDIEEFSAGIATHLREPILLAVANFDQPGKGVRVLVRAFERVVEREPELKLLLSGAMSPHTRSEVLGSVGEEARARIEVLGLGQVGDIPALYRRARLLVLPTMWEASANAMFESWASGTPAGVTAHGGLPEFATPETAVMFDPRTDGLETNNVDGLVDAIFAGLALAERSRTSENCRAYAERFSWASMGPDIEALYRQ